MHPAKQYHALPTLEPEGAPHSDPGEKVDHILGGNLVQELPPGLVTSLATGMQSLPGLAPILLHLAVSHNRPVGSPAQGSNKV